MREKRAMKYRFIDFETANYARESICAVGISTFENEIEIDSFYSLIKPTPFALDKHCYDVHQIDLEKLSTAPDFSDICGEIIKRLDGIVVTHNAAFDMSCLSAAFDAYEISYPDFFYLDTLKIAQTKYQHCKLSDLANIYGVPYENAHNALADAQMLGKIYFKMRDDFSPEICGYYMERFGSENKKTHSRQNATDGDEIETTVSGLPFSKPKKIDFVGKKFVVTGEFATIPRKRVEEIIREQGGCLQTTANTKSNYIIIGSIASDGWANGNYGRKIEQALALSNITFVSELDLKNYPEFTK